MIDIHNHILPGLDDGATDMDESLAMAEIASEDGIRDIIATPHLMPGLSLEAIQRRVHKLNTALNDANIPVVVHPGAEIPVHMLEDNIPLVGLAGTRHLLVEFPPNDVPPFSRAMFAHLTGQGYTITIAHPERNFRMIDNPERLEKLLMPSVFLQITAGSLTGEMGRGARACAVYLLKKGLVRYIASDAHSARDRSPRLSAGLRIASRYIHKANARATVLDNPRIIVETT
ncbi:MAG: CpsB/CapC family capsule biosynthesis tyrosine phosphatase [Thermodesulfobacteriota bacterium]|nr:CpsB/CapC family capsule biosynthesis tyrosine phosphatase [Thermodesulfobacteriota bacterium]